MMRTWIIPFLLGVASFLFWPGAAIGDGSPDNVYNSHRLPWPEGRTEARAGGCGVNDPTQGCDGHRGAHQWAIDFGSIYFENLRADQNGNYFYYMNAPGGYGNRVEITNGSKVSWHAHMSSGASYAPGTGIAQGEWIGVSGNTGVSTGPHLHFEVLINGTSQNVPLSGFTLQHLSDQQNTYHASNNTGPGYSATEQTAPAAAYIRDKARGFLYYQTDPGSAFTATQGGACVDVASFLRFAWNCNYGVWGSGWTQNLRGGSGGPNWPRSLTYNSAGTAAATVEGLIWKVHGRYCQFTDQWNYVYKKIGKPVGDQVAILGGAGYYQEFTWGRIYKWTNTGGNPEADVYMFNGSYYVFQPGCSDYFAPDTL